MTTLLPLADAVGAYVRDGDTVALEGFTHLIPHAAGHEIIRQGRRELTVYRMTPDVVYDQLIGAGAVATLVFSWGGNPGVGSLHRLRDAVERDWPRPLELIEHTHAAMAAGYVAAASRMPFGVIRGAPGADLPSVPTHARWIQSPFDEGRVLAVRAHRIDVTIIHAQRADRLGNVQLWGIVGVQKEAVMAARQVIVTVEEVVDTLAPVAGAVVLPRTLITAVCVVPNGAHPSYALGYSRRDNAFYQSWDPISRDRERFLAWIDRHVLRTPDHASMLASLRETREG